MPAVSKRQFRFMEAVKHGGIKRKGLSRREAAEWVDEVDYKNLPEAAHTEAARKHKKKR